MQAASSTWSQQFIDLASPAPHEQYKMRNALQLYSASLWPLPKYASSQKVRSIPVLQAYVGLKNPPKPHFCLFIAKKHV